MGFWKYSSGICGAKEGWKRMRKEKAGHVIDEMIKESIRKTGKKGGDENRGGRGFYGYFPSSVLYYNQRKERRGFICW